MSGIGPYTVSISEDVLGRIKPVHRYSVRTWFYGQVNSGKAELSEVKLIY